MSNDHRVPTLADLLPARELVGDVLFDERRLAEVDRLRATVVEHVQPLVADLLAAAAEHLAVPIALLNVVIPGVQVMAGHHGLTGWLAEARATPVEWSLCARVVREDAPLLLPDWAADASVADNPLHTVDQLNAYAGVPLRSSTGQTLGAVCVLDTRSRQFDVDVVTALEHVAGAAVQRLEEAAARGACEHLPLPLPRPAGLRGTCCPSPRGGARDHDDDAAGAAHVLPLVRPGRTGRP